MRYDITKYKPLELFVIFLKLYYKNHRELSEYFRNYMIYDKVNRIDVYISNQIDRKLVFTQINGFKSYCYQKKYQLPSTIYRDWYTIFLSSKTNIASHPSYFREIKGCYYLP